MEYVRVRDDQVTHRIYEFEGKYPRIDSEAYAFSTAVLIGDVELGAYSSVWPNATARGDVNRIVIGCYSNIQDNACLHVSDDHACLVGDYVTVGHSVILHACTVEDCCLIGMGATILDGAIIGTGSIIGAGALVTKGTPVPPNSMLLGVPAKIVKTLQKDDVKFIRALALKYRDEWMKKYNFERNPSKEGKTGR